MGERTHKAAAAVALATACVMSPVLAQENAAPRGIVMTLDLSQSLTAGDNLSSVTNPSDSSAKLDTTLTFGLRSETRNQSLAFTAGGAYELGYLADGGGNISQFVNPFTQLAYSRDTANAKLTLSGTYRESAVADTVLTDEFTNQDLIIDNGTRADSRMSAALSLGEGGPYGADLSYSLARTDYNNTLNTTLVDVETNRYDIRLWRVLNRATRLSFSASRSETDEADAPNTVQTRSRYGVSLNHEISDATSVSLGISSTALDTTATTGGLRSTVTDEGAGFNFGINHDLPNGSLSINYGRTIERGGDRDTLRLNRAMDLPSGSLSFSLGGSRTNGGAFDPLYGFTFQQQLKRATIRASLNQSAVTDTDGESIVNTSLAATYTQELNEISGLEVFARISDSNVLSGAALDQTRQSIGMSYNHKLSEDWDLRTGYTHRRNVTSGTTTLQSNQLFVTVSRSFALRP